MGYLICDTDFLIKVTNQPLPSLSALVDDSNLVFATIPEVVKELEGLASNRELLTARRASSALRLVGKSVKVVTKSDSVANHRIDADVALFEQAKHVAEDSVVATLDGKLLSRFEKNKLPYLTLRHDKPFLKSFGRATYLSTKNQ